MAVPVKRLHFKLFKDLFGGEEYDDVFRPKMHRGIATDVPKGKRRKSKGKSVYSSRKGGYGYKDHLDHRQTKQFCTFISSHRYDKALNKKHFDYIQKEGKGLNGEDPVLYGTEPEMYEKRMSKKSYRWIISPDNPKVDLNLLVEELIRRVEINTGYRLNWVAANHYNTDRAHAHVLINGFDLDRRLVNFDRDFVSHVIRETCRDICTEMVGVRSDEEKMISYQKQTTGNYYTQLDKILNTALDGLDRITYERLCRADNATLLLNRIVYLRDINLVEWDKRVNLFIFKNDWKEQLKMFSKYNTYLKSIRDLNVHQSQMSLHDVDKLGAVSGKVVKKYFMQENSFNHAVVLETSPGKYLYVPLFEAPVNAGMGKNIKIEFQRMATPTGGTRKVMNITNTD